MSNKKTLILGILVFIGLLIWGPLASGLTRWLKPDADMLQIYLFNKGPFAILLLALMALFGGLKFYGVKRGSNWWFLIPAAPILLLTAGVFFAPDAVFGLTASATVGWILMALFVGIGEECVFRGILWRALEPRGVVVTALATSTLFGMAHLVGLFSDLPWQIVTSQAVFAFGVGMMLAAVRFVSGSLLAPIALHAFFDAGAILAAGGLSEVLNETLTVEKLLIPGAIFAVWGLACILIIKHRRYRRGLADGPTTGMGFVENEANSSVS